MKVVKIFKRQSPAWQVKTFSWDSKLSIQRLASCFRRKTILCLSQIVSFILHPLWLYALKESSLAKFSSTSKDLLVCSIWRFLSCLISCRMWCISQIIYNMLQCFCHIIQLKGFDMPWKNHLTVYFHIQRLSVVSFYGSFTPMPVYIYRTVPPSSFGTSVHWNIGTSVHWNIYALEHWNIGTLKH